MHNRNKIYSPGLLVILLLTICDIHAIGQNIQSAPQVKPTVGVYYYPWYRGPGRQWTNVMRLHLKPPQKPMAGLYDSNNPKVISEHISQSIRGGIDFWAVSWWGAGQICDRNLRNAILKHPDAGKLKYAILYEATGRFGSFSRPNYDKWLTDLEYMNENYFNHPYYLKIDSKPVLFVYLTREYFRNQGDDALLQMRKQFPQVYLIGDEVFGSGYKAQWAKKFDAITAYDVYGQSVGRYGGTRKSIQFLADNYKHAKAQANSVGVSFIPTIAPGYNDTAVRKGHPGRARYFTDQKDSKEGDLFRAMIKDVAFPNLDSKCSRIMMITSFNEWFEDSQVEATTGTIPPSTTDDSESGNYYTGGDRYEDYGYLYLDILQEMVK